MNDIQIKQFKINSKIYFKNLDGLRFFAALGVICTHYISAFHTDPMMKQWERVIFSLDGSAGETSVSFFFVLSGFLITYLILTSSERINLSYIRKFYIRRALRIWPLYFFSIAVGFIVYPLITDVPNYIESANWKMYVAFLANIDQIYFQNKPVHPNPLLGVHWSVSIEEQFYLIWPWLFFLTKKHFVLIGIFILLFSIGFQAFTGLPSHTISSFHDLVIGGLLAYTCVHSLGLINTLFTKIKSWQIVMTYILCLTIIAGNFQLIKHFPTYQYAFRTVHAIIFSFVILDQGFNTKSPLQVSVIPCVSYFGKISYGLYLLHLISVLLVKLLFFKNIPHWFILPSITGISLMASIFSYRYFEGYFLKQKFKFR